MISSVIYRVPDVNGKRTFAEVALTNLKPELIEIDFEEIEVFQLGYEDEVLSELNFSQLVLASEVGNGDLEFLAVCDLTDNSTDLPLDACELAPEELETIFCAVIDEYMSNAASATRH